MASYNAWQNKSLTTCMKALDGAALKKNRKAFFGSIWSTANHLLWGDLMWMSRFDDGPAPAGGIKDSAGLCEDLQHYLDDRLRTDQRIMRWADGLRQLDLVGGLRWHSGALGRDITKPKAECVVHFFNHQTHHRGQIHAMLTAAGQTPDDTDLPFMPE
jgi:uncharacterized damage-inducible protein DinB